MKELFHKYLLFNSKFILFDVFENDVNILVLTLPYKSQNIIF